MEFKIGDRITLKKNSDYVYQQGTAKYGTILKIKKNTWIEIKWEKGHTLGRIAEESYPRNDLIKLKISLKNWLENGRS